MLKKSANSRGIKLDTNLRACKLCLVPREGTFYRQVGHAPNNPSKPYFSKTCDLCLKDQPVSVIVQVQRRSGTVTVENAPHVVERSKNKSEWSKAELLAELERLETERC